VVQKGQMKGALGSSLKGRETTVQRHEDGATAAIRSVGTYTRPRREGKGVTGCSGALAREDERRKKGGHGGDGAPFISERNGVGDDPRAAPHGGDGWGGSWG
jgi:hypothetical protein